MGQLMVILDTTIVNVALPSIQSDLNFSQSSLTWVIDGYLITFGSLLLLAGRLGDLFGRKRIFLLGVLSFVVASMLCGLSPSGGALVVARLLQGAAAALVSAVIIAVIAVEFPAPAERAKAMSLYTFVIAGGASLGLLLGGVLTETISWHWIFFVNLPIGAVAYFLGRRLIAENEGIADRGRIDWFGSILITAASIAAIYALIKIPEWGWTGDRTLGLIGITALLLAGFVALESRIANPIMPLRVLGLRSLVTANLVRGFRLRDDPGLDPALGGDRAGARHDRDRSHRRAGSPGPGHGRRSQRRLPPRLPYRRGRRGRGDRDRDPRAPLAAAGAAGGGGRGSDRDPGWRGRGPGRLGEP